MSGGPVTVNSVSLTYSSYPSSLSAVGSYVSPQDQDRISAIPVSFKTGAQWNPYRMTKAVRLYKDLNLMVNSLFGHDIHYYRALPKGRSKDVYLLEYSLYEHEDKKCMKIVVPNNEFPDNKLSMGPFGVDFEMPFEIQIDKDYFQSLFGEGTGPQKRDVIYFPRTNRIYEISSSVIFRDFMNEPLYFKATLIKWQPKSNSEQSFDLDNLESMTMSVDKLFGIQQKEEGEAIANPTQFIPPTAVSDVVRNYVSPLADIIEQQFLNNYLVIAEYYYNLSKTSSQNIVKLDISSSVANTLVLNKIYYARTTSTTEFSSVKKFKYLGVSRDGQHAFEYSAGNNAQQHLYPVFSIFTTSSDVGMYTEELGASEDVLVFNCKNYVAQSYVPEVVKYSTQNSFSLSEDRAFSAWFRIKQNSSFNSSMTITVPVDMYSREMTITFVKSYDFLIGQYVSIQRTNSSIEIYAKIVNVIDRNTITVEIDKNVLNYLNTSFTTWKTMTGYTIRISNPKVFIDALKDGKGIRIESWGKKYFIVTSNEKSYFFSLGAQQSLNVDQWYSICVNMSNLFSELTLNVWETQTGTSELKIVLSKTDKSFERIDRSSDMQFMLESSDMDLTNIRLWSQKIETDKQSIVLSQNVVKDSNNTLIIDNAIPQSRLPYISYTH